MRFGGRELIKLATSSTLVRARLARPIWADLDGVAGRITWAQGRILWNPASGTWAPLVNYLKATSTIKIGNQDWEGLPPSEAARERMEQQGLHIGALWSPKAVAIAEAKRRKNHAA